MPSWRAIVNTIVSQTSSPCPSTSSSLVATSRCHQRSGFPSRPSAQRMNSRPSDPSARGCGTVISLGQVASFGTLRSPFSHGTRHRSSDAATPASSAGTAGAGNGAGNTIRLDRRGAPRLQPLCSGPEYRRRSPSRAWPRSHGCPGRICFRQRGHTTSPSATRGGYAR